MRVEPTLFKAIELLRDPFHKFSFALFVRILNGWILSTRRRYITELILAGQAVEVRHFSCFHRFFSQYAWKDELLCQRHAERLIQRFAAQGLIEVSVDDTLASRRGLAVFGTGMHHDPLLSSRKHKVTRWGNNWVIVCLLVRDPLWSPGKVWALPLAWRLYRNRQGVTKGKNKPPSAEGRQASPPAEHRTRPELAVEMLQQLAQWFDDRELMAVGDSAYGGKSVLRRLPKNMDLISHVHPKGALYEPAPPRPEGQRGAARKKGARLPGMQAWTEEAQAPWQTLAFDQFGLHATLKVKVRQALYYKAGKDRLLTIVLTRDTLGERPDQMFYCTRLSWPARQILSCYAGRWAAEVTHFNCKQHLGFADAANRKEKAVRRTAPMALLLYGLIVSWFEEVGHERVEYPCRPWYPQKCSPSFADMLTTLRRETWKTNYGHLLESGSMSKKEFDELIFHLSLAG